MNTVITYIVSQNGQGDFSSLSQAILAVGKRPATRLFIRNGIYREKIYCDAVDLTLCGESRDGVCIVWDDGARQLHADGRQIGTFRSYTAFFTGNHVLVENMTIKNEVGDGYVHGQGIAVAVDARKAEFHNVTILGYQDTLFTGPLPEKERLKEGFLGPKQFAPRVPSAQYYYNCIIGGNVDFVFGGADALFEMCTVLCRGENGGYIAAPSTTVEGIGYVFYRCIIYEEIKGALSIGTTLACQWKVRLFTLLYE